MERQHLWTNAVADALVTYRRFLSRPGRYLYLACADCPCCDPCTARDTLAEAIRRLPDHARVALTRVVARLDAEFERRTLPDPFASLIGPWYAAAWWRRRIHEI